MPTKRKRHMITETAEIEAALEPLRARGIPVSFQRLVIKGAEATAEESQATAEDEERRREARERFIQWMHDGCPGIDLDILADPSRPAWRRLSVERIERLLHEDS
jgi:hypothetical protein